MSIIVVGLSHRVASVELLERAALGTDRVEKLLLDAADRPSIDEALVIATCNRVEVYAEVPRFHRGVDELTDLLAVHTGVPASELVEHLYVRYEDGAVAHLFTTVCGLDSMVVGESQILGQVRAALRVAHELGVTGPVLESLVQQALRVGKRAQSETDLGRAGRSLVGAALAEAAELSGPLRGRRALVVGAGSMAALAATVLHREHAAQVVVASRTPANAARLAAQVEGRAGELGELRTLVADAELVVSCTGASGFVLSYDLIRAALEPEARGRAAREPEAFEPGARGLLVVDLAMPRDVEPRVAELPGVRLIDLETLSAAQAGRTDLDVDAVRALVAEEVAAFVASRRAEAVAPTVVALRDMAAEVVAAELRRLSGRLPDADERTRTEVEKTVRRVVDKLLHAPTVRVKELAEQPVSTSYADALRELFALDPEAVAALEVPPEGGGRS